MTRGRPPGAARARAHARRPAPAPARRQGGGGPAWQLGGRWAWRRSLLVRSGGAAPPGPCGAPAVAAAATSATAPWPPRASWRRRSAPLGWRRPTRRRPPSARAARSGRAPASIPSPLYRQAVARALRLRARPPRGEAAAAWRRGVAACAATIRRGAPRWRRRLVAALGLAGRAARDTVTAMDPSAEAYEAFRNGELAPEAREYRQAVDRPRAGEGAGARQGLDPRGPRPRLPRLARLPPRRRGVRGRGRAVAHRRLRPLRPGPLAVAPGRPPGRPPLPAGALLRHRAGVERPQGDSNAGVGSPPGGLAAASMPLSDRPGAAGPNSVPAPACPRDAKPIRTIALVGLVHQGARARRAGRPGASTSRPSRGASASAYTSPSSSMREPPVARAEVLAQQARGTRPRGRGRGRAGRRRAAVERALARRSARPSPRPAWPQGTATPHSRSPRRSAVAPISSR